MENIARLDGPEWRAGSFDGIAVAEAAQRRLQKSPYQSIRNVLCRWDDGVLFLHGRLPTYYHKQIAQESVARLNGVHQVVNDIMVVDQPS